LKTSSFVEALQQDPPFSFHNSNPYNKSLLVGTKATELKSLMDKVFETCLVDSLMTAIVGNPGTGKTHFLWNLEYRTNIEKSKNGIVVIFNLKDKIPTTEQILQSIYTNTHFVDLAEKYNVVLKGENYDDKKQEINYLLSRAKEDWKDFGLFIGVDTVDECIRKIVDLKNVESDKAVVDLLGTYRLILDTFDNTAVIFALTKDVYHIFRDVISGDQTLRRRILVPNGIDDKPIEFGSLKEKEAYELVTVSMKEWAKRNNLEEIDFGNYPFSKEAIYLAWRVASTPGSLTKICSQCLNKKVCEYNDTTTKEKSLKISEYEMATILLKNKSDPTLDYREKLWNNIDYIIKKDEYESLLKDFIGNQNWQFKDKGILYESFKDYFLSLEFSINSGERGLFVGYTIDGNKKEVELKFVDGTKIPKIDFKSVANNLLKGISNACLFIYITDEEHDEKKDFFIYENEFIEISRYFRNKDIDYTPTLGSKRLTSNDIEKIIGVKKMTNIKERKKLFNYIDNKLKMARYLKSLMVTKPSKI